MEKPRQDPEALLRAIQRGEDRGHRGKLKIFFGYAAGVGKTYAMLRAAHQAKARGVDVVAGYIEPHARPQTAALLRGLEVLPTREVPYAGITLREFDTDAALRRKPALILVDEYAHTNAEGSRHLKRYQDVEELLAAGIDVYTTVNVQHIESLNDTVAAITGVMVRERIPDSAFDNADQVELVDIEPADLLERLAGGSVYKEEQARRAAENFFTLENLTALREIALRRCADRVNLITESERIKSGSDYHADEHILVCLSSSPSNAKIIRTAARMARAFRGTFTALFVQTPDFPAMSEDNKKRLRENMHLAQQLGARIETVYGEDVPYQIAEFARLSGVSKIVIGRSTAARRGILSKPTLTERLIAQAPSLDIHVIPDALANVPYTAAKRPAVTSAMTLGDAVRSVGVLLAATLVGCAFDALGFSESNIIAVYIFGVLVTSMITKSRLCGLVASVVSVMVFNFFFTVPHYTFRFHDPDYIVTFTIMFMVALLTGSLATRLKENASQSAQAAYRTKLLLETNQMLQKEETQDGVLSVTAGQIVRLLRRDLAVYAPEGDGLGEPKIWRTQDSANEDIAGDNERAVAHWVYKNNKRAGSTTDTLSSAKCMYLAIRAGDAVYGVVGIAMDGVPLDSFENSILLSILGESALALESIRSTREKEEAAILAKNEQLRANLLRAISHDLRTPLTSISGSAGNLLVNYKKMADATREQTFRDIHEDSVWLINLVENLLAVTRIEGGQVSLNKSVELMSEIVAEALRHTGMKGAGHEITATSEDELLLVDADARLVVQVVINLVDNALKYTPPGSCVKIHTRRRGNMAEISVADNGPGIPDAQKPHVFEMFYTGTNRVADSRRSMGLGLALCRSIVAAHGGTITVTDNAPTGAVFTFTLPVGEVELHE